MLGELDLSIEIVDEATNGEELVAMLGQHLPDIAFVDIRMPKLNGLEAIKLGKSASPQTAWYILTGFSEFDYAQEAIRLGVSGYLLKPVNPEELVKILSDFLEGSRKRRAAQNKQFERELLALYHGLTLLELEEQESFITKAHFIGAIFYVDSHLEEKAKAGQQFKFSRTVQGLIDQHSENDNRIALFVLPGGELASVGAWEPNRVFLAEKSVRQVFQAIEQEVHKFSGADLATTVLMSKECATYQELQKSLERLQKIAPLRVVCGVGKKLDFSVLNQQAEKPGWLELSRLALSVCRCFQERNYLNYMKALQKFEKFWSSVKDADKHYPVNALADFYNHSLNCKLPPRQDVAQVVEILQHHGEQLLNELPNDELEGTDLIDKMVKFIDENFMLDTGIGQIAERLNITPNYLSTLFHKKTGTNFMSYLKNVRLHKAKELLTDPNIQIQQVAEQVGYFSTRHFARLFYEQFGQLPSEYRDHFKNR
jgi:two-component system response regulator YesN